MNIRWTSSMAYPSAARLLISVLQAVDKAGGDQLEASLLQCLMTRQLSHHVPALPALGQQCAECPAPVRRLGRSRFFRSSTTSSGKFMRPSSLLGCEGHDWISSDFCCLARRCTSSISSSSTWGIERLEPPRPEPHRAARRRLFDTRKIISVGIDRIPNEPAKSNSASVSTFPT